MNYQAVCVAVMLSAGAGARAQQVLVSPDRVRVERWSAGGGVASPEDVIYANGGFNVYYSEGELLCDDITTTLEAPGLLSVVEFAFMVPPGHGEASWGFEMFFLNDEDGVPDIDHPFANLVLEDLGIEEGAWTISLDLQGESLWAPPGQFWCGVRFFGDEHAEFIGQIVGGTPAVGSSGDVLYQPSKGLFDFGGSPEANFALQLGADDEACVADCDASKNLDLFDFLCFQNTFNAKSPYADCDGNGAFDLFDFLCFQNAFVGGC